MAGKKSNAGNGKSAGARLEGLLDRLAQLEERVRTLEAERDAAVGAAAAFVPPPLTAALPPAAAPGGPAPRADVVAAPVRGEITPDILLVISAAVAAFLGERAHVRQVRLVASPAWAQQGRVSVMASHRWAVHRS